MTIAVSFIFYRAASPISWAIRWQTRSVYSHVAIVLPGGTLVEAKEFAGVRARAVAAADRAQDWYTFTVGRAPFELAVDWLDEQLGKGYDYTMVARFLTRRQEARASTGKWFCSELAFAFARQAGLDLLARVEPWAVSPALLAMSPYLVPTTPHPEPAP